jgi:hypothetical protein
MQQADEMTCTILDLEPCDLRYIARLLGDEPSAYAAERAERQHDEMSREQWRSAAMLSLIAMDMGKHPGRLSWIPNT